MVGSVPLSDRCAMRSWKVFAPSNFVDQELRYVGRVEVESRKPEAAFDAALAKFEYLVRGEVVLSAIRTPSVQSAPVRRQAA